MQDKLLGNRVLTSTVLIIFGLPFVGMFSEKHIPSIGQEWFLGLWFVVSILIPIILIRNRIKPISQTELRPIYYLWYLIPFATLVAVAIGEINYFIYGMLCYVIFMLYVVVIRRVARELMYYPYQYLEIEQMRTRLKLEYSLNVIGIMLAFIVILYGILINGNSTLKYVFELIIILAIYTPVQLQRWKFIKFCIKNNKSVVPNVIRVGGVDVV